MSSVRSGRDARLGRASLPFFACAPRLTRALALAAMLLAPAPPLAAQALARPWLDWKSTETEHFVFHYPVQYREWTLSLAAVTEHGFDPTGVKPAPLRDEKCTKTCWRRATL